MLSLYYNGNIITMNSGKNEEAVLECDGIICEVGKYSEVYKKAQEMKREITFHNLKGMTLMPAFIDPHSHFSGVAHGMLEVDLSEAYSFEEIGEKLKNYVKNVNLKEGNWIIAGNYDQNQLKEREHPRKDLIDQYVAEFPVVVKHKSGHMGTFNQKALDLLGVRKDSTTQPGGTLEKKGGIPTGYMEENTFVYYLGQVPMPDKKKLEKAYMKAQEKYASYGITTVQEGMMASQLFPMYEFLTQNNKLILDVVGYVGQEDVEKARETFPKSMKAYHHKFKINGIKIFLDGSPQGGTAFMEEPYVGKLEGKNGYPTMTDDAIMKAMEKAVLEKMQLLAHCNGDAAARQYVKVYHNACKKFPDMRTMRPVMIHAQFLPKDLIKELEGMIPSFFIGHIYHWGDIHALNLGRERANRMSPAGTAAKEGIVFTFHQDAPVIEPDMLETVWCATNRLSKNAEVFGEEEKISVYEALKAITINAAFQYGEEDKKGSIEKGKYADFVVLSQNPLSYPTSKIRDIKVLQTIRRGEIIFRS